MNKRTIILLSLGLTFFLFSALYIITRPSIFSSWDFTKTGQIGDTIGGILSPILNIVGSLLIFSSFLSQNKANDLQSEYNNFSLMYGLYKDFKDDFNNLSFQTSISGVKETYYGKIALSVFTEKLEKVLTSDAFKKNSFFEELLFLLGSFNILIEIVQNSKLNKKDKEYVLRMIHYLHTTRIKKHTNKIVEVTCKSALHHDFYEMIKQFNLSIEDNYKRNFGS
ncbi:MAG: hypothetical protein IPI93_11275 [Sphingobacteriaceae bacterium]|nr:hypothetical protein [Sphingobacteriaceae bacterium]